jgi:hypothetical protein
VNGEPNGTAYLQVMPHVDGHGPTWNVFLVSDESPRITLAGSVDSCDQARHLAARQKRPLRITRRAWEQMLAAGVAPARAPDGVAID